jgi:hypothetical protein
MFFGEALCSSNGTPIVIPVASIAAEIDPNTQGDTATGPAPSRRRARWQCSTPAMGPLGPSSWLPQEQSASPKNIFFPIILL